MCIIILHSSSAKLTKRQFRNAWTYNPDGAGYLYAANGELYHGRDIHLDADEAWDFYTTNRDRAKRRGAEVFAFHLRFATAGDTSMKNCHPFIVGDKVGIMHNGTLAAFNKHKQEAESDTARFVNWWVLPAYEAHPGSVFFLDSSFWDLTEQLYFSHSSRLLILNRNGDWRLLNRPAWRELKSGILYSTFGDYLN